MLCIGFGQGIQPLLGYCVGAKDWKRYKETFRFSLLFSFIISVIENIRNRLSPKKAIHLQYAIHNIQQRNINQSSFSYPLAVHRRMPPCDYGEIGTYQKKPNPHSSIHPAETESVIIGVAVCQERPNNLACKNVTETGHNHAYDKRK